MRFAVVIAMVAALALLVSAANGAEDATRKATLRLKSAAPLAVRGTRFVPGERVRLSASSERQATRRVTANGTGAFVAQLSIAYDRCNGLVVLAVGSLGSRAGLKLPQLLCPPGL